MDSILWSQPSNIEKKSRDHISEKESLFYQPIFGEADGENFVNETALNLWPV